MKKLILKPQGSRLKTVIPQGTKGIPIDIIVPIHGRLDLTMKCIRAIYENTSSTFHLIVLDDTVDDGSPEAMTQIYFERLLKQHDNITYIHKDEPYREGNQFFNEGFEHCKYEFVATVMNSVTVEPDWELIAAQFLQDNPKVGIIGFKTLQPTGVIETAGITMIGFTATDIGRDYAGFKLSSMYGCEAVQWAFTLLRLKAVKGNVEEGIYHGFVGYDDIDNSFEIRKKGWDIWYCGLGVGTHEVHATRGTHRIEAMQKNMENAQRFYKRQGYTEIWDKANASDTIHLKSQLAKEIQGLSIYEKSKTIEKMVV